MDKSLRQLIDLARLGGVFSKIRIALRSGDNTIVFNAGLSERGHIMSGLDRQSVYITNDRNSAIKAYDTLKEFYGDRIVILLERDEVLLYRGGAATRSAEDRVNALNALKNGVADCVVTTREAMMQKYPNPNNLISFSVVTNTEINIQDLLTDLIKAGYKRRETVEKHGEFSLSGDILTVFCVNMISPVRISFFDNLIENITEYDIDTLQKLSVIDTLEITPTREFIITEDAIAKAEKEILCLPSDARIRANEILDDIKFNYIADGNCMHMQWLAAFLDNTVTLDSYLDNKAIIVYEDANGLFDQSKLYYNNFIKRHAELIAKGETLPRHADMIIKFDDVHKRISNYTQLLFTNIAMINKVFESKHSFNLNASPHTNYYMNFNAFYDDIRNYNRRGILTVICCGDEHTAESIKSSLYDNNIYAELRNGIDTEKSSGVVVTPIAFSSGLNYPAANLVIIGRSQIIKKREQPVNKRKRKMFVMPKCGDYVVHEVHGIGRCNGIERLDNKGVKKDYVVLEYQGGDTLYVPVDQMDRLQRYSGSDIAPKLSKIGGKDWEKVKNKVKASVKEMAFSLVELYRERQQSKGFKYSPDTEYQKQFEDAFEWQETDDQLRAIDEIKSDMTRGIVMDRLLCGDVGYGKTEVAFRAIFKTVMEGKQAAILAPTTILAKQHFNTAVSRFEGFPVEIVLLTRFQSMQEIKNSIEKIKSGKANLIIATHKLLSDKIKFYDLGLLVLDEEQRFGVEDKEKIKLNAANINVLTLSATPIPRTLNMALTGIRDISVLEMPPKERRPVETYVTEMSDALLEDAIRRELNRGGQVFVLYNRVETIDSIAARIAQLVPEAKLAVGHGQMSNVQLENVINSFYSGETNVFVATTIIENGVDLPNANTLIVYDSDRLGLSAMYQLRGRVGRSDKQAYAYFTVPSHKSLTEDGLKRLNAITEYTEFGSGYKIAMRDLEIRGAGNVLGREQSGHICKVGYDMYCKLLQEAVEEINGDNNEITNSEVEMQVDLNAYLDEDYISNIDEKLRVFKEIAEVSNETERAALIERLKVNYGNPDAELINLIDVAMLKNMCAAIGASKVIVNDKGAALYFDERVYKNPSIIDAVSENAEHCVLSIEKIPKLVFDVKGQNVGEKMRTITKFVRDILKNAS